MKGTAKCYAELRDFVESVGLVDCHDHTDANCGPRHSDPIKVIINFYFISDLISASSERDLRTMLNSELSLDERWPVLQKAWKRTCHTGYAQVVKRVLKRFYGIDELTLDALKSMQGRLLDLGDPQVFDDILEQANIKVRIANIWPNVSDVLDGTLKLAPRSRLAITLPAYHNMRSCEAVQKMVAPLNRRVTSLDQYVHACRTIFEGFKKYGAIAFKDQTAYERTLEFDNPTRAEAEKVFNWMMEDPRRSISYPDGAKPLEDYLFHEFMRMAQEMDLPVQLHTGHMAWVYNDIAKTNAVGLTSVLELHRDVRFDLFHANWPYDGEILYLAKNYPNVTIDFCWANIIDPIYCQRMFMQALSCVPHGKIHGYGSDFGGYADSAWSHASIARDNIAIALSQMVEMEYLGVDEAKEVAHAWLFGNANEFFRLGL